MKRGQAAMEFLMTYGWAILVVLIAIGALAYFGVLNPSRFLPESCTVGPGIGCDDFKVTEAGAADTIQLLLRNGIGESLTDVIVTSDGTGCGTSGPGRTWTDGEVLGGASGITLTCGELGGANDRVKVSIDVTYTKSSSGLPHTKTGSLTSKLE